MAVRTDSVVLYWGPDFDGDPWGASTCTGIETAPVLRIDRARGGEYEQAMQLQSGLTSGTYRTSVRRVGALHAWGSGSVVTGAGRSGVGIRLTDGVAEYRWDATTSAWIVAAAGEWTSPDELYAHLVAWARPALGFVVRLQRAKASDASPVFLAVAAVARLLFDQVGNDPDRASSWMDDLLHRVLIPACEAHAAVAGAQEFVAGGDGPKNRDALRFAGGLPEVPYNILGVDGVHDTTTDTRLGVPVSGAWDAAARTWTPTSDWTNGHRYHVRYQWTPWMEHSGDREHFTDRLPAVVFEGVSTLRRRASSGFVTLPAPDGSGAVSVRAPTVIDGQVSCQILAARTTDRDRIWQAIGRWVEQGRVLASPSTSLCVFIDLLSDEGPSPVTGGGAAARRFTIFAQWQEWPGDETSDTVLQPGGFAPEIHSQEA